MAKVSVLFSSAGRRVQLMQCFRESAEQLGIGIRCLAADLKPEISAACSLADKALAVPRCTTKEFVPALLKICQEERVDLVVPTIDTELEILSAHRSDFAALGTTVSVSNPAVVGACRNKLATAQFLDSAGVQTPRSGLKADVILGAQNWRFPLIAKPVGGSSSVGLMVVNKAEELSSVPDQGYLIQEMWKGTEYTVNLFFDNDGLVCAIPHRRVETRGGEVSKGWTERVPALLQISQRIGNAWKTQAFGALCFQAIVDQRGEVGVFEINARFGGGYPLAHAAGARFSTWLLEIAAGLPSTAADSWTENVMMLRYDAAVFRKAPSF